jgi:hypothetical protein
VTQTREGFDARGGRGEASLATTARSSDSTEASTRASSAGRPSGASSANGSSPPSDPTTSSVNTWRHRPDGSEVSTVSAPARRTGASNTSGPSWSSASAPAARRVRDLWWCPGGQERER